MTTTLRWGVLGAGNIAKAFANGVPNSKRAYKSFLVDILQSLTIKIYALSLTSDSPRKR